MDSLTRRLGWTLMQLFTLKWSCFWFFVTIAKEQYFIESNPGTPSCGQAGGQSPSQVSRDAMPMLEELRNWRDHRRDEGGHDSDCRCLWRDCECQMRTRLWQLSHHWDRFWGRLQGEVLGALKSEAQQKPWKVPLACKQLLFPSVLPAFKPRSTSPAWWYSHSGIPEFEKSWFLRHVSKKWWWGLVIYIHCV